MTFARPAEAKRTEVKMPARLCFISLPRETVAFFTQLRQTISSPKWQEVKLDHSALVEISPAAALVLMAELYYGHRKQPHTLKLCIFPKDRTICDLLGFIGYFRYFKGYKWTPLEPGHRLFLEHRRGEGVDRLAAGALVNHLRTVGKLPTARLYEALIEGMQNAAEHGYAKRTGSYRSWWLLGYRDSVTGEIAYCFYDQGLGIPTTKSSGWAC